MLLLHHNLMENLPQWRVSQKFVDILERVYFSDHPRGSKIKLSIAHIKSIVFRPANETRFFGQTSKLQRSFITLLVYQSVLNIPCMS